MNKKYRKTKSRKHYRSVPQVSGLFGMLVLIVSLASLVAIDFANILVTGVVNDTILIVVTGLVGALNSRF